MLTVKCPTVLISTASLPDGIAGMAYNQTLTASAGTSPYTWSVLSGSLPAGLSLSPGGIISGVPTQTTSSTFTIETRDAFNCTATKSLTLAIVCPTLTLTPATLNPGFRGTAYSQALSSSGGTSPYTYTLTTGALPSGLSLSSAGLISGTPTVTGSFGFTVRSTDASGCTATSNLTLSITGLSLGDLVWNDTNQNGLREVGENGIAGVMLQLFLSSDAVIGNADDASQGTTTTNGSGGYAFTGLAPGRYYARITTPPVAQPYSSGTQVASDNGVNDDNNGLQPGGNGATVTSPMVVLALGREPGDIAGGGDLDMTVDFAFRAVPAPSSLLLEYNLNTASGGLPAPPSLKNTSIVNSAKIQIEDDLNGLLDHSETTANGPMRTGALSRRVRDWDSAYDTSFNAARSSYTQLTDSLWTRFDLDATATGNIGTLHMDVRRVNTLSPTQGKAFLTWREGAIYHTAVSTAFTFDSVGAWHSMSLNWSSFLGGATALPTGAQLAGKSFLLEIYLWGGDGTGYVDMDNIILEGNATSSTPSLSIGDYVWQDLNCNGVKNSREPGLSNLTLQLMRAGADLLPNTADDTLAATTITDASGYYLFTGLSAGAYFVKVPTPDVIWSLAAPADTNDNGEDNDNNGIQPGGGGTAVHSPVIGLALGTEPGNLSSGGGNQDMSVDLGFCASLSLGNFVWSDIDNDGVIDSNEGGVAAAVLELYSSTDTVVNNGDDVKVGASLTTDTTGAYSFSGLANGYYYVKLSPPPTHPNRSTPRVTTDNGVDNDNNGTTQAASGAPIYSIMVTLSALTEPGNLLAPFGGNVDNTLDFGLRPVLTQLGNLVFKDGNNNGHYDDGEGVGGIRVDLHDADGVFLRNTTTSSLEANRGSYLFSNLPPGGYYVHIPSSEFRGSKPLVNTLSLSPATPLDDDVDDDAANGDSGVDSASPSSAGISSPLVVLAEDTQPTAATGETGRGADTDDADDDNGNMTVDFGFRSSGPSETGCYHFAATDANQNGSLIAGSEWVPAQPHDFTYSPNLAHIDNLDLVYDAELKRLSLDASLTQVSGRQVDALWLLVSTGSDPATADHAVIYIDGFNRANPQLTIYRYDPLAEQLSWQTTGALMLSTAPGSATTADVLQKKVTETGSSLRFQFVLDVSRVNNAENWTALGINSGTWEGLLMGGNAGLVLHMVDLAAAPTYNSSGALMAFNYTPSSTTEGSFETDPAGVFTILTEPCSVSPWVSVGNLVWSDTNNNGLKNSGEVGISGASVQLFDPGADEVIGGSGLNADTQVGSAAVTSSSGSYSFTNLVPGKYFVRVTPPTTFRASGGIAVTLDNGVDNDNNGSQPGGEGTSLYSPILNLAVGTEPNSATDGDGTSSDATVDFGLWSGFTVGNLVWNDVNNNGLKGSTESGVGGVLVELMNPGADGQIGGTGVNEDSVSLTTSTNSSGAYTFRSYTPGLYYVRITPTTALSLASSVVVAADDGVNNDNNGTQMNGAGSAIVSPIIALVAGTEPGNTGTTNTDNSIDFGLLGCPTLTISPTSLPLVTLQTVFSQTLSAAGGNSPYLWNVSAGSLPSGLSLSSTGVLSGTTTAATGNYTFTARATDSSACIVTRSYTLTVVCPTLTMSPTSLPVATQGSAFSQTMTAAGGTSPYAWSVAAGSLPLGLTLSSAGLLSGTPTAPGSYSFTLRATDARSCQVDQAFLLSVQCPSLALSPTSLPAATLGTAYAAQTLTATGGTSPYTWSFSGTLPTGMGLSSAGLLSGTPTGAPGSYSITVTATDGNGCASSRALTLTVNCGSFVISPVSLPAATQNVAYVGQTLTAAGGTGPYQWAVSTGALPAGMTLSASGNLTGTPTAAPGTFNFTARATDAFSCQSTRAYSLVVACPVVTVTPNFLPNAVQLASYSQALTATGGSSAFTWDRSSGSLPLGMSFSSAGVLSGTPLISGNYTFTLRATNASGCTGSRSYTLTVGCPPINITPTTLSQAQNNVAYSQTLSASGGTAPYTWARTGGSLPTGMSLSLLGVLTGTPTSGPGTYSFTVAATDVTLLCSGSQTFTLTVTCPVISIAPSSLANGTVGTAYSRSVSAATGTAPYTYTLISGSLPTGLSLSSTGLISGTPTVATTASFTLQAQDVFACTGTRSYTLTTVCPALTVTPSSLPTAYYNVAYTQTLSVTGGTGPYTWSLAAGAPPAGISLSSAGVISGSSTVFGTASFSVRVTDTYGCATLQNYSLTVRGLALGDLVYEDSNFNGLRDNGEPGVRDVVVQLWDPGADNAIGGTGANADVQLGADITTGLLGTYTFQNLLPDHYYVRLLPPGNLSIPGGNPTNADNGVDNDNNSTSQPSGAGTVIYGPVIQLTSGAEPSVDDGDLDTDFTVDFGLYRGLSLGNLVWQDSNDNAQRNSGELGIDNVLLQIWSAGADGRIGGSDDALLQTTTTAGGGLYSFVALAPGQYFVRIPAPPTTHPLSSSSTVLADNGVDNDDNGIQVAGGSIYSPVIDLESGEEPGSTGGGYADTTVDFGLLNIVPTAYVSATQDDSIHTYSPATGLFTGVFQQPFGNSHSQGNGDPFDVPYAIELGPDGNWYVAHFGAGNLRRISPSGVDQGTVLNTLLALVTSVQQFTIGPDGNFYVLDAATNRVVRFHGPLSASAGQPIGSLLPYTFISQAGIQDMNFGPDGNLYLVIQDGSTREVRRYNATTGALMNVIVTEAQLVSLVSGGQPVAIISGIDVHGSTLYGVNRSDGEIFRIDLSIPATPGLPQLVATIVSAGQGEVDTRDIELNPGDGMLYIAGYNWSKPVVGGSFTTGSFLRVDPAGAPNGSVRISEAPIPTPPGPNNEIWSGPRDLAFGRPFVSLPESVAIGSVVWNDTSGDGIRDAGENGIPGVRVELWRDVDGNAANGGEVRVGWTFTDLRGMYYFSGQAPARYQIKIPAINFADGLPLAGAGTSSPLTSLNDDLIDNDDNGIQDNGSRTETVSPLITLTAGQEPTGNAITGTESGVGGELDDFAVDANGDMTVDFGFVEPGFMSIGNLVFNDSNGSRRFDVGEGVNDVVVQLYYYGQIPNVNLPLATTITANGGKYLFSGLFPGQYFVHVPALQFQLTGVLRGLYSLEGEQGGDDDQGEDSLDSADPASEGVSTGRVILTRDSAPTAETTETGFDSALDDANDANTDLTVDIGLFRPVAIGNLIFADSNSNGRYDPSEGLNGITLELYQQAQVPGTDTPIATRVTANGGRYLFDFIRPGNYFVHVPASMFAVNAPLYQRVSVNEGLAGDDDVGEDGLNAGRPALDGVSSNIISLFPGSAPTDLNGETGLDGTTDNENDAAIDLTIDFGFQTPVGVGNLVFIDSNLNGVADASEGVSGVKVEVYRADQNPGVNVPLFTRTTDESGHYFFDFLNSGSYVVFIPPSEFAPGTPLADTVSVLSSQTNSDDDDIGEDGIDEVSPALNGIRSRTLVLTVDGAPTNASTETGLFADQDSFDDDNFDLTVDFGFNTANPNAVGIGNLVFRDANANAVYDLGEGVDGVRVQLFAASADPQTATPLAATVTSSEGIYHFSNLTAGDYIVHIPASEFAATKPLEGWTSLIGQGADEGVDDDSDENGSDTDPTLFGVTSVAINLETGAEPQNFFGESGRDAFMDDANDANTDLTVDFAFFRSVSVGNLVFIDGNYNGRADAGEGVSGVEVQLFYDWMTPFFDSPVATAMTDANGHYLFADLTPGLYFLHVPYTAFLDGSLLYRHASVIDTASGDDDAGEDGLDDGHPDLNGISTAVFTLNSTAAPVGTQEAGLSGSSDDAADASVDLTRDLGFVPSVQIGNLVFKDANGDSIFDPNIEIGIDGVAVQLWSNTAGVTTALAETYTASGGLYSFNIAPGSYHLRVAASQFISGGGLENLIPSQATPNSGGVFVDDNVGQDAYNTGDVGIVGARTAAFVILPDLAPDETQGETGHLAFEDDLFEKDSDLTVDLGFAPKPLRVGNLVFADVNEDGVFNTADDFGIPGVLVQLFTIGDDPTSATPLATAYSQADGTYSLRAPQSGSYYIHIPASQFATEAPLSGAMSVPDFGTDDGADDGTGEDTLDFGVATVSGVSSISFDLNYGTEPSGAQESGHAGSSDDAADTDTDVTIDLGFTGVPVPENLGVGNTVFVDANGNGHYDANEGVEGVWMLLYRADDQPGAATPYASTFTDGSGHYFFSGLPPGGYTVHVAADNFKPNLTNLGGVPYANATDGPLYNHLSVTGQQSAVGDDHLGEDGDDATNPSLTGSSSQLVILQPGQCPVGSVEGGSVGGTDDAADGDTDLTIDFGFYAIVSNGNGGQPTTQDLGIGNLVFIDSNSNGRYNSGEGRAGVLMHLYRSTDIPGVSTPLLTTTTDSAGRYLFGQLTFGSYVVHVAADNFKAGLLGLLGNGPLYNYLSVSAHQTTVADDQLGEDGVDSTTPPLNGISSMAVVLQPGGSPTGSLEAGFEGSSDDVKDADYNLTIDFGFRSAGLLGFGLADRERTTLTTPQTVSATPTVSWQSFTDGIGAPEADLDADGAVNLLEYALGTDPTSGVQTQTFSLQTDAATGTVNALLRRPSGGRTDIIYHVETRTDLRSGDWSRLALTPAISQNNDGTETLRFSDVATQGELGFLRIKVMLDADLNGTPEATATSQTQAWVHRDITEQQTFSMPLLTADVFRGTSPLGVKSKLNAARAYDVEVLSGAHAGQRYELDEAATTDAALAFESTVPDLTGTRLAVRPHWTVADLFPVTSFQSGTEAASADRLLFYDAVSGSFLTSYLSAQGWTGDSDGSRIVAPGEGLLIHARSGLVSLTFTGAVRDTAFAQPLRAGVQFIGSGFPLAQSAQSLGLTTESGFTASATAAESTRLRLWNGDTASGDATYRSLYLHSASGVWRDETDTSGVDVSAEMLMQPTRAWFLVMPAALPDYQEEP